MKRLVLILIFMMFAMIANANFDVHIIYFKPTDAGEIDIDYYDLALKDIQKYYQAEMTRHGYEGLTFPLELDDDGKVKIHTIEGKNDSAFYDVHGHYGANSSLDVFKKLEPELPFQFNNTTNIDSRNNVHLVILGGLKFDGDWRGAPAMGFTWHGGKQGGNALETMDRQFSFPNHHLAVLAHELGHAFGLDPGHNGTQETFNGAIIAWGKTTADWGDRMRILDFEAAVLNSRPIFRKIDLREKFVELDDNIQTVIYTGSTSWVTFADADEQSRIAKDLLLSANVQCEITKNVDQVREWMLKTSSDSKTDILITYGALPSSIYALNNIDGSVAEKWIETTDGNTIINHGDYFGYVGHAGVKTLQDIMDTPDMLMWDIGNQREANVPMIVTTDGKVITPTLTDFKTDRAFQLDKLAGNWFAEKILASNSGDINGTRADPVIVRDGNLGRIGIVYQTFNEINPKGRVVAELIVNYLLTENKNSDLGIKPDDPERLDTKSPISVDPYRKLTVTWGSLKSHRK